MGLALKMQKGDEEPRDMDDFKIWDSDMQKYKGCICLVFSHLVVIQEISNRTRIH